MEQQSIRFDYSMLDYWRLYQIAYLFAYGTEIAKRLNRIMYVFQAEGKCDIVHDA